MQPRIGTSCGVWRSILGAFWLFIVDLLECSVEGFESFEGAHGDDRERVPTPGTRALIWNGSRVDFVIFDYL